MKAFIASFIVSSFFSIFCHINAQEQEEIETVVRLQHFEPGTALFKGATVQWDGLALEFETKFVNSGDLLWAGRFIWAGQKDNWLPRVYAKESPLILLDYATSKEYEESQQLRDRCGERHDGKIPNTIPDMLKTGGTYTDTVDKRTKIKAYHHTSMYTRNEVNAWRDACVYEWKLPSSLSIKDWSLKFSALKLEDKTYPLYSLTGTSVTDKTLNCCSASLKLLAFYGVGVEENHGRLRGALNAGGGGGGGLLGGSIGLLFGPAAPVTVPVGAAIGTMVGHALFSWGTSKGHGEILKYIFENRGKIQGTKIIKKDDEFKIVRSKVGINEDQVRALSEKEVSIIG